MSGSVSIYAGRPFAGFANPSKVAPPAGALARASGSGKTLQVQATATASGWYSVYVYAASATPSSGLTVTYQTPACAALARAALRPAGAVVPPIRVVHGLAARLAALGWRRR